MIANELASIVITAQSFNPSIFTETWLTKNDLLNAEKIEGLRIYSPELVQFQTKEYQFVVAPVKLQITFTTHEKIETPINLAVSIIKLLPHTPYQALGLNFDYFVTPPPDQDFGAFDKKLFGTGDCNLLNEFFTDDARFGRYFSKNYNDYRLKLDIKPVKAGPENKDMLQFSFNFHNDVSNIELPDRAKCLIERMNSWDTLKQYSAKLVALGINA